MQVRPYLLINHNENEDENEKLMTEFYKYLYGYSASTVKEVFTKRDLQV